MDADLVELHYQMPLNEIVYDFLRCSEGPHQGLRLL